MQMNFEIKKAETIHNYKKVDDVAIEKNNYEREIRKIEKENESLTKELIDMQHHWKNITSSDINTTGKKQIDYDESPHQIYLQCTVKKNQKLNSNI